MPRTNPHGNALLGGEHSTANRTFVHLLCGAEKLHGGMPHSSLTGSVYILGIRVAHYSLGVRYRMSLTAMHHLAVNTLL